MDIAQYYLNTLSVAFSKLGPLIGYGVVGYFLFFKLPFWFLLKNLKSSPKIEVEPEVTVFKNEGPKKRPTVVTPEMIFELHPDRVYSKKELKKKYYELLKKNHPDKVGEDFRLRAERRTKDINSAYIKLKSKAA